MWNLVPTDEYKKRYRWFEKKRPRELQAVLRNLARYFEALEQGTKPKQIQGGFIHVERENVVAVDQKGGGGNLSQARLYLFADSRTKKLHLITLGGKDTQKGDVEFSKEFAKQLKNEETGGWEKDHVDTKPQEQQNEGNRDPEAG